MEGVGCGYVCIINLEKNYNVQLKIHKCSLGVKITHGTSTASTLYIYSIMSVSTLSFLAVVTLTYLR